MKNNTEENLISVTIIILMIALMLTLIANLDNDYNTDNNDTKDTINIYENSENVINPNYYYLPENMYHSNF